MKAAGPWTKAAVNILENEYRTLLASTSQVEQASSDGKQLSLDGSGSTTQAQACIDSPLPQSADDDYFSCEEESPQEIEGAKLGGKLSYSSRDTGNTSSSGIDLSTPAVDRSNKFVTFSCKCGKCTIFSYISGEHKCSEPPKIVVWTPDPNSESRPILSEDVPYSTFKQALKQETRKVHVKFCDLLLETFRKLESEDNLEEVKEYTQSLLMPPGNEMYNQVDKWPLDDLFDKITSFKKLRQFLQDNFCSWYNHDIVSDIRKRFLFLPEKDEGLNDYKKFFSQFCGRSCFLYLEDLGPQPRNVKMVQVTCKIYVNFEEMSKTLIEKLEYEFIKCIRETSTSRHYVMLKQVREGCTELIFQAPPWIKNIPTLTESQVSYLKENGFIEIKIGNRNLLSESNLTAEKRGDHSDNVPNSLSSVEISEEADSDIELAYTGDEHDRSFEMAECDSKHLFTPILPWTWTAVANKETKKPMYVNIGGSTSSTQHGYPLYRISKHPYVILYDEPQEREFSSTGGYANFDNGIEVMVLPDTTSPDSNVTVKVQPSFASRDVFVMPEGINSVSPSYLISCESANREVTVIMEHHVRVSTKEEANDLIFLQADPTPEEGHVYKYQKVPEGRSEFTPGEIKGKLTTKKFSKKFYRIGSKIKRWFGRSKVPTSVDQDHNLYTVRVYMSPTHSTSKLAIICVSLYGRLYSKFLDVLDNVVIPRDYPEVSSKPVHQTVLGSLCFKELITTLVFNPIPGWIVRPDRHMIHKTEIDLPENEKFTPEDLHDYPPRITCMFYPEMNAPKRSTCRMSLTGFEPQVEFLIPLNASKLPVAVDTTFLQDATDDLRKTVLQVSHTELGSILKSILSLMEKLTDALRLHSLNELAVYTDSVKTEVRSLLTITRRVLEKCKRVTIKESIAANLSKMEVLSHQLCLVTKVKLKHCPDQLEETAALVDLVKSGAYLLKTVECVFRDMQTLSVVGACVNESYREKRLEDHHKSSDQMDCEIEEKDITYLAQHFDNVELYLRVFELTTAEQVNVRRMVHEHGNQIAMAECLSLWRRHNPSTATLRALLDILLRLRKEEIASKVRDYYHPKHKP